MPVQGGENGGPGDGQQNAANAAEPGGAKGWRAPVRAEYKGTSFLIGAKDAWYVRAAVSLSTISWSLSTGTTDKDKKAFCVLCEYKNLGPREGYPSFGGEVETDKGRIYPAERSIIPTFKFARSVRISQENLFDSVWRPSIRPIDHGAPPHSSPRAVGESGEALLVFEIPFDEEPVKLINCLPSVLNGELPHVDFPIRYYSNQLGGFLPRSPEEQIRLLIQALGDRSEDMRIEAALILGDLGPAAKPALPALEKVLPESGFLGHGRSNASKAAREAMMKIDPDELARLEDLEKKTAEQAKTKQEEKNREAQKRMEAAKREQNEQLRRALRPWEVEREERARKFPGPLTGEWKDKDGIQFQIDDDGKTLTIKLGGYSSSLRGVTGELTRKEGEADSFEGTLTAQFSENVRVPDYSESVTAKLNKSGQLELRCPKWPDPKKPGKTKTHEVIMSRVGPATSKSR